MVVDYIVDEGQQHWRDMSKDGPPPPWLRVVVFYPNKSWGSRKVIDYLCGYGSGELQGIFCNSLQ